ncbi:sulfurtransferase TusA family protein [Oceanospirillum sanctuarii]|uniref:sulfurtransferase TusA family protein n=1 Tax=Oceanospirillum sanctuarii TaxID=1434821 RepID=UPI000A39994F|nr:sulfurtransferase TusA family protein [Oceanospirillum sanctuarii]
MAQAIDQELDTRGLHCPMPLLKAKLALNSMQAGEVVRVVATDAGSWDDFEAFVRQSPHELISREQEGDEFVYCIRKGE